MVSLREKWVTPETEGCDPVWWGSTYGKSNVNRDGEVNVPKEKGVDTTRMK